MRRGKVAPPNVFCLYKPNFVISILPVNISKFKYVHYGYFGTILGPSADQFISDPPGKLMNCQYDRNGHT